MTCTVAKRLMSSYLDGAVTRSELAQVDEHLQSCAQCMARFKALHRTQELVGSLGRKPAPPELMLRLQVALSQETAKARLSRWDAVLVHWQNAFNATMVPATAGLVTTIIIFGLLIGFLYPGEMRVINDVPTVLYTPPELQSAPFEMAMGATNNDELVIEAYVGPDGRVEDYRILAGTDGMKSLPSELKNMLIFTTFRPATSFGRPTSSRAILSFSKIQVKG